MKKISKVFFIVIAMIFIVIASLILAGCGVDNNNDDDNGNIGGPRQRIESIRIVCNPQRSEFTWRTYAVGEEFNLENTIIEVSWNANYIGQASTETRAIQGHQHHTWMGFGYDFIISGFDSSVAMPNQTVTIRMTRDDMIPVYTSFDIEIRDERFAVWQHGVVGGTSNFAPNHRLGATDPGDFAGNIFDVQFSDGTREHIELTHDMEYHFDASRLGFRFNFFVFFDDARRTAAFFDFNVLPTIPYNYTQLNGVGAGSWVFYARNENFARDPISNLPIYRYGGYSFYIQTWRRQGGVTITPDGSWNVIPSFTFDFNEVDAKGYRDWLLQSLVADGTEIVDVEIYAFERKTLNLRTAIDVKYSITFRAGDQYFTIFERDIMIMSHEQFTLFSFVHADNDGAVDWSFFDNTVNSIMIHSTFLLQG